ncbi:protein Shroom2 isoform X2 [Rhinoraja longicauda]
MAGEGLRTKGAAAAATAAAAAGDEPGGSVSVSVPVMGERRAAEGSRCLEVALSGGAPWGFTLRGGQEHREPLLITKIEEGSKAAAVGKLQIGDEFVSINDVILTGFRQEAICLVKGSYKALKMVVRRRNEPAGRPHSWHSTKFTDSPQEAATIQLSSSGMHTSWHSRYHATSSSNNLADPWDQTNLHRVSHQFSSLGSMDSLDQPGRLSPAKSNNSLEQVAQPGKRDSAYSSFSTNSSTPDYTLSSSRGDNCSSTEYALNRVTYWEASWPATGRAGQAVPEQGGSEERQYRLAPEDRVSPRTDEQPASRHCRASIGPVWHVPEKRATPDCRPTRKASPPPPLPIRSDSYAATKVHGGAGGAGQPEGSGLPRQPGPWGDWEGTEGPGRRNQASSPRSRNDPPRAWLPQHGQASYSPCHTRQRSDDVAWQRGDRSSRAALYPGPQLAEAAQRQDPGQSRVAPPAPPDGVAASEAGQTRYFCLTSRSPHQVAAVTKVRLESPGPVQPSAPAPSLSARQPRHQSEGSRGWAGLEEVGQKPVLDGHSGEGACRQSLGQAREPCGLDLWQAEDPRGLGLVQAVEPQGMGRGQARDPHGLGLVQAGEPHGLGLVQARDPHGLGLVQARDPHGLGLVQAGEPHGLGLVQARDPHGLGLVQAGKPHGLGLVQAGEPQGLEIWQAREPRGLSSGLSGEPQGVSLGQAREPCGQDLWQARDPHGLGLGQDREPHGLCPSNEGICPRQTPMLHSLTQESRRSQGELGPATRPQPRSDRFATALRNEIQSKRAQLQKSRSAAALSGGPEGQEPTPVSPPPGSSPATYKDGLKEAQARVLRATSFQRRDLGPLVVSRPCTSPSVCPPPRPSPVPATWHPLTPPLPGNPQAPGRTAGGHQLGRVGGRKRLTQEQRLRSYSEPGKMNEVGAAEEEEGSRGPGPATSPPSSVADRRHFFEVGARGAGPSPAYGRPTPRQGSQPPLGEAAQRQDRAGGYEAEVWHPEPPGRDRAASLGIDRPQGRPDQIGSWSLGSTGPSPISPPERTRQGGERGAWGNEAESQRLGTFAEYQATWREQKKLPEARSSGRYHSADNILDQSFQEPAKPQYVHERSRSSPSTDFYSQDIPFEVRRGPESFQKKMAHFGTEAGASASRRHLDSGSLENNPEARHFQLEATCEEAWSERNAQRGEHLPQERHGHPVDMLSRHHYPEATEVQGGRQAEADSPESCPRGRDLSQNWSAAEDLEDPAPANRKRGAQTRADKCRQQDLLPSGEAAAPQPTMVLPDQPWEGVAQASTDSSGLLPGCVTSGGIDGPGAVPAEYSRGSEITQGKVDSAETSTFHCPHRPVVDTPRSPSPQFAPQRLTDKPPVALEDDGLTRIEKVTENNKTVKKVPIKIVRSESQTEKEGRHNLLNNVDLVGYPNKEEQPKALGNREHPYSLFAAYSRQEQERPAEADRRAGEHTGAGDSGAGEEASSLPDRPNSRKKSVEDIKSAELVREIVVKDRSLADILYPNSKMKTTMDLMEGIFPKDETFMEKAQQRRKLLPRPQSPRVTEEREEETIPIGVSLTTSSIYYSTSAPKAELLNKMKDMQQQMEEVEDSEDELNNDLTEKKQELIDSISKKLQVLREARESLQDDIQGNNLLGDEVEDVVKKVCKPNEFDKFRMFIGDLDKVVNLLLSLSGRLARVENALNTLEESASPDERRTLTQKQKLLTRQHEDAKELKENLDRRERLVFDILSSYLTDELLQDYEHFVKMKSALTIEQRELEDKIKLGEEQLKCLLDSLPLDCKPK